MATDLLQALLIQAVVNYRLFVTSSYEPVVVNLLTTCYVQTISILLEQLVVSLLASSTLLQDDNNLFQTCQQMGQVVRTHFVNKLKIFARQVEPKNVIPFFHCMVQNSHKLWVFSTDQWFLRVCYACRLNHLSSHS